MHLHLIEMAVLRRAEGDTLTTRAPTTTISATNSNNMDVDLTGVASCEDVVALFL